jgi:hypothetical protein
VSFQDNFMRKPLVQRLSIAANLVLAVALVAVACGQMQNSAPIQHPMPRKSVVPAEVQSAVSTAMGQDLPNYHVRLVADGFEAATQHQRLVAHFNSEGIEARSGAARWLMEVRGFGYRGAIQTVSAAAPQANQNRVEYRRGTLTEWYVNGPVGLEQGFTVSEPPRSGAGNLLTIALALSGNLHAAMQSNGNGLSLTAEDGKHVFRYSGLSAHDASGKALSAWIELAGRELLLRADDAGARYPVVIDPWVQLAELTASDGVNGDELGISVSISGNTVVAGAENATVGGNAAQGAAYVFVKPADGWSNMTQTAKLTASDGKAGDGFGGAIYIAGNTIAVGACLQSGVCNGPGKVYVFLKPKSGWTTTSKFKAELTASDGASNDGFSNELAVSADGDTIAVGAAGATINGNVGQGAAYVFVKPTAGWKTATQTARLTESPGAAGEFAGEVSVSGDGSTVFVGAPGAAVGANTGQGVAYLFLRPARGWKTTSKFAARLSAKDGAAYDDFGYCQAGSTCISSDGTTVLAAAPQENFATGTPTGPGKAYVFMKPASGWKTTSAFDAKLTASNGLNGDLFGWSAAITSNTAVVGAVAGNGGTGAAYVFTEPKTGWKTTSKFAAELLGAQGDPGDGFGFTVSISGNTAVVGALNHPYSGSAGPGAAYVFGP